MHGWAYIFKLKVFQDHDNDHHNDETCVIVSRG
jgi:hypothetical protein